MITRTQPLLVAARIQAGRTYQPQTRPDVKLTIIAITDDYLRNSISAYRLALVRDADGFYFCQPIYATQRYFELPA